jgi:ADP-ribose pyrophosphatase
MSEIPGQHAFSVTGSTDIYQGAILALRVDDVAMPGSPGRVAKREVVEHFGAVAIAAVDELGEVTLIRQYRHPLGERLWELPAGLLDVAGEAPVAAARRELREEVGLEADSWRVLVDLASSPGFTDEAVRVFVAEGLTRVQRPAAHDEEADIEVVAMPLEQAISLVFAGEIVNAAAVAGLLALAASAQGGAQLRPAGAPWAGRPTRLAARKNR